jgi:intracellular sulfur oxidation DsrE/DsrF family protein
LKDESLTNGGITIGALAQKGVRFAVCAAATKGMAGILADKVGSTADAVFAELTSALIPNGLMVPAGIVTVNRAQEHGYAISYAG